MARFYTNEVAAEVGQLVLDQLPAGAQTLTISGIAGSAAVGAPSVRLRASPASQSFNPSIVTVAGRLRLAPASQVFGSAVGTVAGRLRLAPTLGDVSTLGAPGLRLRLAPAPQAFSPSTGATALQLRLSAAGLGAGAAVGSVALGRQLAVSGLASGAAVGVAQLRPSLGPAGLSFGADVGAVAGRNQVGAGLTSSTNLGAVAAARGVAIAGLAPASGPGTVAARLHLTPTDVSFGAALGAVLVAFPSLTITISDLAAPAMGSGAALRLRVGPASVGGSAIGAVLLGAEQLLTIAGIDSASGVGSVHVAGPLEFHPVPALEPMSRRRRRAARDRTARAARIRHRRG